MDSTAGREWRFVQFGAAGIPQHYRDTADRLAGADLQRSLQHYRDTVDRRAAADLRALQQYHDTVDRLAGVDLQRSLQHYRDTVDRRAAADLRVLQQHRDTMDRLAGADLQRALQHYRGSRDRLAGGDWERELGLLRWQRREFARSRAAMSVAPTTIATPSTHSNDSAAPSRRRDWFELLDFLLATEIQEVWYGDILEKRATMRREGHSRRFIELATASEIFSLIAWRVGPKLLKAMAVAGGGFTLLHLLR